MNSLTGMPSLDPRPQAVASALSGCAPMAAMARSDGIDPRFVTRACVVSSKRSISMPTRIEAGA